MGARTSQFNIPAAHRVRKINSRSWDIRDVCLQDTHDIGPNQVKSGIEPIPSLRRIDPCPRNDAHHREITTSHGQRAQHRRSERSRQRLERRFGTECAYRRLLCVEIVLERVLDRRITERFQRAEVVAHRCDVRFSGIRQLAEGDAVFAPFGEQIQRRIQ